MKDTTATYQRLQLQIVNTGCPICGLCQEAVTTYLDTLLWESSNDLNVRELLTASLGFCGRHSRDLLTFGGQRLAAAVMERASLLAASRLLPELIASTQASSPSWFRLRQLRLGDRDLPPEHCEMPPGIKLCPACVRQAHEESRSLAVFLAHLQEFSGPLQIAGGLCLPHFVRAAQAANQHGREILLAVQERVWRDLAEDLEEFIRKHNDYHHADPISERGRTAVERTIAALTGEFPVR